MQKLVGQMVLLVLNNYSKLEIYQLSYIELVWLVRFWLDYYSQNKNKTQFLQKANNKQKC